VYSAQNNGIPFNLLLRLRRKIQHNTLHNTNSPNPPTPHPLPKKKWATFTYTSPQIRKITNLFKHTDVNISFKVYNTMAQLLKPERNTHPSSPFEKSDVYAISCVTCGKAYVGQTSRSPNLRYKELTRYIRHNNPQSAYTLHILQHQHVYGPMDQTMTLLKPITNISFLTPYELFFIQSLSHTKILIAEQHTGDPNPLFQLAFKPPTPCLT
jgi:hypothetical protein